MAQSASGKFLLLALSIALSACAASDPKDISDAVTAPLGDLNLVHGEIPAVLVEAERQPYALPKDSSCEALEREIRGLDAALGPDLDAPASDSNPSLIERGSDEAKSAAIGTIRRTTEGVVPFRRWIRKLTGAERYSKKVRAAIVAGTARRAFIKGLRVSKGCG